MENGTEMPRVYYLDDVGYNGEVQNPKDPDEVHRVKTAAIQRAYELEERIPLGVYYKIELPTYEERLKTNLPILRENSPIEIPYYDADMRPTTDLTNAIADFVV